VAPSATQDIATAAHIVQGSHDLSRIDASEFINSIPFIYIIMTKDVESFPVPFFEDEESAEQVCFRT
jgi:hypothetical protein